MQQQGARDTRTFWKGKYVLQVVCDYRLIPLGGGIPRPRRALARKGITVFSYEVRGRTWGGTHLA